MELAKLTIHPEGSDNITALFNPNKLVFAKSVQWEQKAAKERDVPELQFKNGQPRSLTLELFFDTYDSESAQKKSVREYTDELFKLTLVYADKHRPPICELSWGTSSMFFKCVLASMTQQFILFMEDGTPVRAKCDCTFNEWRTNAEDQQKQSTQSADIAKKRVVKFGETLSSIASEVYLNPGLWRPIAEMNGIDDPLVIEPGTELIIPVLSNRSTRQT
jgi:hypothetical protein